MNNSVVAFNPCGIEVSHLTLVVALRCGDRDESPRDFPNTPDGHQAVPRFLGRSDRPVRGAMKSTGLYGLDLALWLHRAGVAVMVANPRAVCHFAKAPLQRSKNDQLDAAVLREFAGCMPFQAQRPLLQVDTHLHWRASRELARPAHDEFFRVVVEVLLDEGGRGPSS